MAGSRPAPVNRGNLSRRRPAWADAAGTKLSGGA